MIFFIRGKENYCYPQTIEVVSYSCGFCGDKVSSDKGYKIGAQSDGSGKQIGGIYICPNCQGPTFFAPDKKQYPGPTIGNSVKFIPDNLQSLYEEARNCFKCLCYTSSVLICRKMLMNIAVEKGAKTNLKFIEYVEYLSSEGYLPPDGKTWVDHIRKKGNEATHEIKVMEEQDAKDLIIFLEMLLKFVYEFPRCIPSDT